MGMSNPQEKPFDLLFALANSLVWGRYRSRIQEIHSETIKSLYMASVLEHVVRIQRLTEGLVAFSTTGVQDEVLWLTRPVIELFSSQCLLQFGTVKSKTSIELTKNEKAEIYDSHSAIVTLSMINKHDWSHIDDQVRADRKKELELKISSLPLDIKADRAWHGKSCGTAFKEGLAALPPELDITSLDSVSANLAILIECMHFGLHGNSFSGHHVYANREKGGSILLDNRAPEKDEHWIIAASLAMKSIEMLASELDENSLIEPMLESARSDLEQHPNRFVSHFPTALIGHYLR